MTLSSRERASAIAPAGCTCKPDPCLYCAALAQLDAAEREALRAAYETLDGYANPMPAEHALSESRHYVQGWVDSTEAFRAYVRRRLEASP